MFNYRITFEIEGDLPDYKYGSFIIKANDIKNAWERAFVCIEEYFSHDYFYSIQAIERI